MTNRSVWFVLLALCLAVLGACAGGDEEPADPGGSKGGDGKADASLVAVFLDFEWDGELTVPSGWDPSWYMRNQHLYTIGHLNGERSLGRLDKLEVTNKQTTTEDGVTRLTYHAKMPVAWGKKNAVPTSYTLRLPRDASSQGLERFTETYMHDCVDYGAHDVDSGSMWYYYRPNRSGCNLAEADVVTSTVTVTPSAIQTTGRYPEYDKVWEDGVLRAVAIFGKNESGATSSYDAGISAFNRYVRETRTMLASATITTEPEEVPNAPGPALTDVTIRGTFADGREVEVVILLVDSIRETSAAFDARYATLTQHADVISYAGHSGLGANIRALAQKGRWVGGQYVVVLMNGCDTYAYVERAIWNAHAAVNPNDPQGTKHADILMNAMPAMFSSNATNVRTLVESLMNRAAPKTFEQIFGGFDSAQVVLVSGEEDNTYVPGGGGGGGEDWEGLDESGTVARDQEIRFETPVLPAGQYTFEMTGSGDADLYVRTGSAPTTSAYDCRPYESGSAESCRVDLAADATIHIMVRGYAASSDWQLTGRGAGGGGGGGGGGENWEGLDEDGTVTRNQEIRFETPALPPGHYTFEMTGSGDADLYVRTGTAPTTSVYDCRPYKSSSTESCRVDLPAEAPIHVMIRGYANSSNYQLAGRPE